MDPRSQVRVVEVDQAQPTEREAEALHTLLGAHVAQTRPHDAAPTVDDVRRSLSAAAAMRSYAVRTALAWSGDVAVGQVTTSSSRKGDNEHLLQVEAFVAASRRRQGVGTYLLGWAAARARAERRALLIGTSTDRAPEGAAFARRLGASVGLVSLVFELAVADLDPALIATWLRAGPARAPDVELVWLSSPYPAGDVAELAVVMQAMNDIPLGDLQVGDRRVTPATLRDQEATRRVRGEEVWTLAARRTGDGALVGVTETLWHRGNPAVLLQLGTVVLREARGRGIGRWLKAAMLERVRRERPSVRVVRTDNASMNAPMQAINDALGFRLALTESVWQVGVEQVEAALRRP